MKPLSLMGAVAVVALLATSAHAQRGPCPHAAAAASASPSTAPTATLATNSALAQQAYLRQLAYQQQLQQAMLERQRYWQQQYFKQQQELAGQEQETRQRILDNRRERRLAAESRRADARARNAATKTVESKLAVTR